MMRREEVVSGMGGDGRCTCRDTVSVPTVTEGDTSVTEVTATVMKFYLL